MRSAPATTNEIVALRKLGRSVDARWVDWALALLEQGHDTPSLRILASEWDPINYFELSALVTRTLRELGIREPRTQEEAARTYATELARQILDGSVPIGAALSELAQTCIDLDYQNDLYDFYLLFHAHDDLQAGDDQWYWPDATRDNVDAVVRDYCEKWVRDHGSA